MRNKQHLLAIVAGVFGYRRVLRWHVLFDAVWFVALKILFFGTFEGMATAVIGGGLCTLILLTLKKLTPEKKTR